MGVRTGNGLQFEAMFVDRADDIPRPVAWIDADGAFGLFTAHDAGMLLKRSDGDFFDDHGQHSKEGFLVYGTRQEKSWLTLPRSEGAIRLLPQSDSLEE